MDSFEHPTSCGLRASWSPFRWMAKWRQQHYALTKTLNHPQPIQFSPFPTTWQYLTEFTLKYTVLCFLNVDINIKGIAGLPSPLTSPQHPSSPTRVGSIVHLVWKPCFPSCMCWGGSHLLRPCGSPRPNALGHGFQPVCRPHRSLQGPSRVYPSGKSSFSPICTALCHMGLPVAVWALQSLQVIKEQRFSIFSPQSSVTSLWGRGDTH